MSILFCIIDLAVDVKGNIYTSSCTKFGTHAWGKNYTLKKLQNRDYLTPNVDKSLLISAKITVGSKKDYEELAA